jgi:hypothetical protein
MKPFISFMGVVFGGFTIIVTYVSYVMADVLTLIDGVFDLGVVPLFPGVPICFGVATIAVWYMDWKAVTRSTPSQTEGGQ